MLGLLGTKKLDVLPPRTLGTTADTLFSSATTCDEVYGGQRIYCTKCYAELEVRDAQKVDGECISLREYARSLASAPVFGLPGYLRRGKYFAERSWKGRVGSTSEKSAVADRGRPLGHCMFQMQESKISCGR